MEVMNDNYIPHEPSKGKNNNPKRGGNIFFGVLLILIGMAWLFYNFDIMSRRVFHIIFSWQMLMVAIGGYLIAVRKYVAGVIVGGLGMLFVIMDVFNVYVSIGKVVLPSVIIAIGASILLTKIGRK